MRFISDKITFTPAMKTFVVDTLEKKLIRLMTIPDNVDVKLTKLGDKKVKVDLSVDKFRAQASGKDFYVSVKEASTKIKELVVKHNKKDTSKDKIKITVIDHDVEKIEAFSLITKEKIFELNSITVEDAIAELEYTDYAFYVFRNIDDNDNVSIVYKRHLDDYGLIKCR